MERAWHRCLLQCCIHLGWHIALYVSGYFAVAARASRDDPARRTRTGTPSSSHHVTRPDAQSVFQHLADRDLSAWLEQYGGYEGYGLGDLWEKNVLGARP